MEGAESMKASHFGAVKPNDRRGKTSNLSHEAIGSCENSNDLESVGPI